MSRAEAPERRREDERGTVATVEKTSAGTLVTVISGGEREERGTLAAVERTSAAVVSGEARR